MNVRLLKIVGGVALALVVALAVGWLWGSSGRSDLRAQLRETDLRFQATDARARLLAARVDLYAINFGAATQNLEAAKVPLQALAQRYETDGEAARVADVRAALGAAEEARRLAAQVNQSAQAAAERALTALDRATRPAGR